jgi:hypothetical protein
LLVVSTLPPTPVKGIVAPQVTNARSVLASLMAWHFVEAVDGPTLKFVQRGGASAVTIPYADLVDPLVIEHDNDNERPGYLALSYINDLTSFERGIEYSDRLTTDANGTKAVEFAILASPSEAKGRADTIVYDAEVSRTTAKFSVALNDYPDLEQTDVVTVTDDEGTTYRVRILRLTDQAGVRTIDAVLDDPSILSESGITSEDYAVVSPLRPGESDMILLDTGLVHDEENTPGLKVAVDGTGRWFGASIQRSLDDSAYVEVAQVLRDCVSGLAETALATFTGGWVWDEVNTLRVKVTGELSSSTRTAMQADPAVNLAALANGDDWELLRFRTVTLVSANDDGTNTYDVTCLLRGMYGTEQFISGHAVLDQFALMTRTNVATIVDEVANIGATRYYRGVTLGRSLSSAGAIQYAQRSIRLKPWAPTNIRGERDGSGNLTLTWNRRTRLSTRMGGSGGSVVPLGEESERYQILIRNAGDTATLRTIDATSETTSYSAADQTTDFGSPQSSIKVRIAQVSAAVGAGYYTADTI